MPLEELEKQLLSLSPIDRLRIIQSVIQSLIPNITNELSQGAETLNCDANGIHSRDRSPNHPLRSLPLTISPDFDEPMTELWDALEQ
ncbi:hypothetical protein IQ250_14300 [Pseudanabaenaceae cyanobacterium LEGE 13415]|nr:hypothetical protein [Pseudanabaenaceae cyanobacterium LEGE 13415]